MAFSYSPKIVTDGLVLYLDAANSYSYVSGSLNWNDLSRSQISGSLINGPTFSSANNGSIVFDGVNDYAALGTFSGLGSSNRTLEIWFQVLTLSASGGKRIVSFVKDDATDDVPAFTITYGTTTSSLDFGFGGTPYNGYITGMSFALNTWVCLVGSINSNTMTVYKDNILINSVTNTGTVATNPLGYVGRYNANYGQYGNIRVGIVKLYNRSLSASEILQNYNATKTRFNLT